MATPQLMPNLTQGNAGQAAKGMQAMGVQPIGNGTGSNMPGPTALNALAVPVPGGLVPTTSGTGSVPQAPNGLNFNGVPPTLPQSNQDNQNKQLTDIFGKGVGGDLSSFINNLGSSDSSYMQAYAAAMAPQNAEGQATLDTTLGNSGVSANSSTAAIANADYNAQITSQEGLQEQQLQQMDQSTLAGILTGVEGPANKEASTSVWGDIGSVLGAVGSDISGAAGPGLQALGDAGLL